MSYTKKFVTILFFLFFSQYSFAVKAECNTCVYDFSWPGGGAYPQIIEKKNELFVISDVAGVWKSTSENDAWQKANSGLGNLSLTSITFSKTSPDIGYVTTARGIYLTKDNAKTWEILDKVGRDKSFNRWDNFRPLSIHSEDPELFFFGTKNGLIYKGSPSGASLIGNTHDNESVKSVLIHTNNQLLTVGTANERLLYENINGTWELKETVSLAAMDMQSLDLNNKEYLFSVGDKVFSYSIDGAKEWSNVNLWTYLPLGAELHRIAVKKINDDNVRVLVAWFDGWESGMLYSDDLGLSWHDLALNTLQYSPKNPTRTWKNKLDRILSISIGVNNPNTFFMSTYWGIWKSTDRGLTWKENSKKGASNRAGSSVIYSDKGDILTASMDVGLIGYRSQSSVNKKTDSVAFALLPNSQDSTARGAVEGHVWNVISNGEQLVATNSPWDSTANQIVVSSDYGVTWTVVNSGLPTYYKKDYTVWHKGFARALEIEPISLNTDGDTRVLYLGIDQHGLFTSTDGGYNWQRSEGQPGSKRIYNSLSIDPINQGVIYWGAPDIGMFISEDSGNTWHRDGLVSMGIYDSAFSSTGVLYAGVQRNNSPELYVKNSLNDSWRLLHQFPGQGTVEAIAVHPNKPSIVAIGVNGWSNDNTGKAYITFNSGASWEIIPIDVGVGVADMAFSPYNNELAMLEYAGGLKVIKVDSVKDNLNINTFDYVSRDKDSMWLDYTEDNMMVALLSHLDVKWQFDLQKDSKIEFSFKAKNLSSTKKLPVDYDFFKVEVFVDGVSRGVEKIIASDTGWVPHAVHLGNITSGRHTITLRWLNNISTSTTDSNLGIGDIEFLKIDGS